MSSFDGTVLSDWRPSVLRMIVFRFQRGTTRRQLNLDLSVAFRVAFSFETNVGTFSCTPSCFLTLIGRLKYVLLAQNPSTDLRY